jgi:hypothetical protein
MIDDKDDDDDTTAGSKYDVVIVDKAHAPRVHYISFLDG